MKIWAWVLAAYPPRPCNCSGEHWDCQGTGFDQSQPAHYCDIHKYDLLTLQPPPGPVIAGWIEKYGKCPKFRVVFSRDKFPR